jgi:hypothetical protein
MQQQQQRCCSSPTVWLGQQVVAERHPRKAGKKTMQGTIKWQKNMQASWRWLPGVHGVGDYEHLP